MNKNKKNNKDKDQKEQNRKLLLSLVGLMVLIAILIVGIVIYNTKSVKEEENTLAYTDLIKEISYGNMIPNPGEKVN